MENGRVLDPPLRKQILCSCITYQLITTHLILEHLSYFVKRIWLGFTNQSVSVCASEVVKQCYESDVVLGSRKMEREGIGKV